MQDLSADTKTSAIRQILPVTPAQTEHINTDVSEMFIKHLITVIAAFGTPEVMS